MSSSTVAAELSQKYQRKTDKQHILDNPDTYIGSIENMDNEMWVYNNETERIELKTIHCNPGLYKLFDEGIVNCRDHIIRMLQSTSENKKTVSFIKINIISGNEETNNYPQGTIIMENDGNGIDVAKHPEYDVWIPEMIFANLRTSTNYNKEEKRIVGGKNGFGFKLVLIWSSYGSIETVDHIRGLKYTQSFSANLDNIEPPKITKVSKTVKPYTRVVFTPDYQRLKINGLSTDMISLFKKRIYDIAALSDMSNECAVGLASSGGDALNTKKIKVYYNDNIIPIKSFHHYIDYYIGTKDIAKRVYECGNERWEYAVALSPTHEFIQISFVNGIATFKGGKHVDYLIGQITRKLADFIEKKKKVKVNANSIKEQLMLFLRCDIENPAFDSQTKDYMNTPIQKFGSSCTVSDAFIEKVAKTGVMEVACSLTEAKENRLSKKTDGTKTKTIRGIANLIDANHSGTSQSKHCILILCEGLSAMSGIISGLSSDDRNTIGIYPLKGKLLNVRGEQTKKINENKEIADIKKILGLESGREYKTIDDVNSHLRYGKIMYMTDSDHDGSHIKGLCINLFHSEWASLIRIPGFLSFMNTPILRAKKGSQTLLFYNEGEYQQWKLTMNEQSLKQWTIKYYKGLGTSTSTEFKEYFIHKKIVDFVYTDNISDEHIDKVFNKKRADDRKIWLENFDKSAFLDTTNKYVKYEDFIDKELIHFSTYDCARSIPNMVDGLKISLRKILYCAFKRNLTTELKVAQFSGYVSEHSMYHHGEASLNGAIVNMAQTFVGSNNIHLLEPLGQFGSRNFGGSDSASERYIYTHLTPITRSLFCETDDTVLKYLDDYGVLVEPEYYCPVIPFVLLNGISGIGTGFSCNIPPFNPIQIINYIKNGLEQDRFKSIPPAHSQTEHMTDSQFLPYYEGFKGTVERISPQKFLIRGVYQKINEDTIHITELPVGTWTMPYITYLEELADGVVDKNGKRAASIIKDFTNLSTELSVNITVQFPKDKLAEYSLPELEKILKLTTTESITNMYLFDADSKLHKYHSIEEIIHDFYNVRIAFYIKRKHHLIEELQYLLIKLTNRARYIQSILNEDIDLRRKTNDQVEQMLETSQFERWGPEMDYVYLTKMPMNSVTNENVSKILQECKKYQDELHQIQNTTINQMWMSDLLKLEHEYISYKLKRECIQRADSKSQNKTNDAVKQRKTKKNA